MGRWCERGEGNKGGWEMGTREGGGLRTKSRARTPNILGNTISLSNTTSESREVVADVGGTTGVDEALPPISEDNVIPAHSANVDASRGGSIAPPIAAGPVKR